MIFFSVRLRELREGKHLSQQQVAQRIGVTRSMVSAYENDLRFPSYDILIRIASMFGVSTDYLLCIEGKRMLDISELTEREAAAIYEMVDLFLENRAPEEKDARMWEAVGL